MKAIFFSLSAVAFLFELQAHGAQPENQANFPPFVMAKPPVATLEYFQKAKVLNEEESNRLTDLGQAKLEEENPGAISEAIEDFLKQAVARNPNNFRARGLLASAYIRSQERFRWNEDASKALAALLDSPNHLIRANVEFVAAVAERLLTLHQLEEAEDLLKAVSAKRAAPELIYLRAKAAWARHDFKLAESLAAKLDAPEALGALNPRHALFTVEFAWEQKEKSLAKRRLSRLLKESPAYAPALLAKARFFWEGKEFTEAWAALAQLWNVQNALTLREREEANLMAGDALLAMKDPVRALAFAEAGSDPRFLKLEARVKATMPETSYAYGLILEAMNEKQPEKALQFLVQSAETNRDDPVPFLFLAATFEKMGDVRSAMDRYRVALQTRERPVAPALELARLHTGRFELAEAAEMIQTARERGGAEGKLAYLLGLLAVKKKNEPEAKKQFQITLDSGVLISDAPAQLGALADPLSSGDTALTYFSLALELEPFHTMAMRGLSMELFRLYGPEPAMAYLLNQLKARPGSSAIMTNLAMLYLRSGDRELGKRTLKEMVLRDGTYAEAFRLLGELTKEEGDGQADPALKRESYRYALASFEMFSKLAPANASSYMASANLYFDFRDLTAAAEKYRKVLELVPNHPLARLRLAQIARNSGEIDRAIGLLNEEIRVDSLSDAAYVELGNIEMGVKEFEKAEAHFKQAIKINGKNAAALFGLGVVKQLNGKLGGAMELFKKAAWLNPAPADVYRQMANLELSRGQKKQARDYFWKMREEAREQAQKEYANKRIAELESSQRSLAASTVAGDAKPAEGENLSLFAKAAQETLKLYISGHDLEKETHFSYYGGSRRTDFAASFGSMSLPQGWRCWLSGMAWICQDADVEARKDVFVTITTRAVQPSENGMQAIHAELEKARKVKFPWTTEKLQAEVRYTREISLGGMQWVDSLHFESELPGYYTRYLANVTNGLSMLVAFNVRKEKYSLFFPEMDDAVSTLRAYHIGPEAPSSLAFSLNMGVFGISRVAALLREAPVNQIFVEKYSPPNPAQGVLLKGQYKAMLEAWKDKGFTRMQELGAEILASRQDFNDTLSYQALAQKEVRQYEKAGKLRKLEERWKLAQDWTRKAEKDAKRAWKDRQENPNAVETWRSLVEEIYLREPDSRFPASMMAK